MKILLEEFRGRFEIAEDRISELEDKTIIESEEQKEKRQRKIEQNLRDLQGIIKWANIHIGVQEGEEGERGEENIFPDFKICLKTSLIW